MHNIYMLEFLQEEAIFMVLNLPQNNHSYGKSISKEQTA